MSDEKKKIDITKIKLKVCDIPGAGKEVFAFIDQPIPCCEFTMKGNAYQPITHTCQPSEHEHKLYTERWIQFEPKVWSDMIEEVYAEMVKLWNEKHGEQPSLEEQSLEYCVDIFNDFSEMEIISMPPSIIKAWEIGKKEENNE